MASMNLKINVVGAGVCGLGSAWSLAQQFPLSDITIFAEDWHPNTTSDHGFGIVILRCIDFIDDVHNVFDYVNGTVKFCQNLPSEQASEMGIKLVPSICVTQELTAMDIMNSKYCRETGIGLQVASKNDVRSMGFQMNLLQRLFDEEIVLDKVRFYVGHHYVIDTGRYLPWLKKQLQSLTHLDGRKRVQFVTKRLLRFDDAGACDLLVNCSGLGAKELACDPYLLPIRGYRLSSKIGPQLVKFYILQCCPRDQIIKFAGQYLSLDAPDRKHLLLMNHTFIVPRFNDLAVGSVYQIGRTSRALDLDDTEDILRRAEVAIPAIRQMKVRKIDVGIRPGRIGGPRVELELLEVACNAKTPVIHNYGHGPRGIAQHYGCAMKVCRLALSHFGMRSPRL